MKIKPKPLLSQYIPGKLKRREIIPHDELYIITYDRQCITIAVIDEDITHFAAPRYPNMLFSQRQSAENAVAKLNKEFNTTAFGIETIKCLK